MIIVFKESSSPTEEEAERMRGSFYGYKKGPGKKIPFLQGKDRRAVFDEVCVRQDMITGKREQRLDVGFSSDGVISANIGSWRNQVLAEFFTIVSLS